MSGIATFFIVAFIVSWAMWIGAALTGKGTGDILVMALIGLGGISPMVAGIMLLFATGDPNSRKELWSRLAGFRRIGTMWYPIIILLVPLMTAGAIGFDALLSGTLPDPGFPPEFLTAPMSLLPFALFIFFFGPLPEEIGWHGYALDALQSKHDALTSSLILGTLWSVWHLPLFFIEGTYQHGIGVLTPGFYIFMIEMVPQMILMTWFYNNNGRSTLSAVLFHFMINLTGELTILTGTAELYLLALWVIGAVTVCLAFGTTTMTGRAKGAKIKVVQ